MVNELIELLKEIQARAGIEFSGIGLIISDSPDGLPIISLTKEAPKFSSNIVAEALAEISTRASPYHDGFHVLSSQQILSRVSQYFSPPIITSFTIDRSKRIGGRYVAALFGSAVKGVQLTGIASNDFGIAAFRSGKECFFEAAG